LAQIFDVGIDAGPPNELTSESLHPHYAEVPGMKLL
jgi:hypothetical protein